MKAKGRSEEVRTPAVIARSYQIQGLSIQVIAGEASSIRGGHSKGLSGLIPWSSASGLGAGGSAGLVSTGLAGQESVAKPPMAHARCCKKLKATSEVCCLCLEGGAASRAATACSQHADQKLFGSVFVATGHEPTST